MHYIVLDMEWNQPVVSQRAIKDPFYLRGEIIQIGAVKLDHDAQIVDTLKILISPVYYKRMNSHVSKITGIKTADLKDGKAFSEAIDEFRAWCGDDCVILTWGCDDMPMLKDNMKLHGVSDEWLPNSYNLQVMFDDQIAHEHRQFSLAYATEKVGEVACEAHDALNDAISTARVCKHIDLAEGIKNYADASHMGQGQSDLTDKVVQSRSEIYQDKQMSEFACNKCDATVKCGRWIGMRSHKSVSLAECTCGEKYFLKFKFKRIDDEAYTVSRSVYPLTDEWLKYYNRAVESNAKRAKYHKNRARSKDKKPTA